MSEKSQGMIKEAADALTGDEGKQAEGQSLENVATPLTAIEEATGTSAAGSA